MPKLISSFKDFDNIYLVTTIFEGISLNDLRDQILSEEQIKFVSACVIQSLEYLRKEQIIHRDIMMKNIILDTTKYFNVIDFSFSIKYANKNNKRNNMITYDMVTPPEMLSYLNYDYNSDYYRLGSVIYYLIFKKYPLMIKNEKNISDIFIDYKNITNYTYSCIDFLNKLLVSDYKKRIGYQNIKELKIHQWFNGFNWTNLERREIVSPFEYVKNEFNQTLCTKFIIPPKYFIKYNIKSKEIIYQNLMNNFDFVNLLILKNISISNISKEKDYYLLIHLILLLINNYNMGIGD